MISIIPLVFRRDTIGPVLLQGSMKIYKISPHYSSHDPHGQPLNTSLNQRNNSAKAVSELAGICRGILIDGVVTKEECEHFTKWVMGRDYLESEWPWSEIVGRVRRIVEDEDGQVDESEQAELAALMQEFIGGQADAPQPVSTALPLDEPEPEIIFPGREFVVTGKFAFGTRSRVFEAILERGGLQGSSPTPSTDYLVIGHFGSRDWKETTHGLKIINAVNLRQNNSGIKIISEEAWTKSL